MLISPVEKRGNDMIPNPDQHEADQDWMSAHLSGQRMGLMRCMARKLGVFLFVLGADLKELGQRMRPRQIPTKHRVPWSQSPHH